MQARVKIKITLLVAIGFVATIGEIRAELNTNNLNWKHNVIQLQRIKDQNDAPVISDIAVESSGARFAVVGDDHSVRIFNTEDQKVAQILIGHTDWVRAASFSPAGKLLATGGNDRRIIVWDTTTGKSIRKIELEKAVSDLVFNPAGDKIVAVGFDETLTIFDVQQKVRPVELKCPCNDMTAVAISSNGNTLAAAGRNGIVRLWHFQTGNVIRDFRPHTKRIHDVVFSKNDQMILTCSDDRYIAVTRINKVISPVEKFPRLPAKVTAIAVLEDGRIASGSTDNMIRIWDLNARTLVGQLEGHVGTISALSNNKRKLFSGSFDTRVRIWESAPNVAQAPALQLPGFGDGSSNIQIPQNLK